ncbi:MAG: type II toxin-antitoxin system HicA family toxin [Tannerella sp.]|jgi:mRNA interferase HicA|nr:type II toxin-antitoxin system HicA family toxin [Tannerella sp.]
MKYSEFHRKIKKNGWMFTNAIGSHYFYEKDGIASPPIPYHGSKEIGEGLRIKLTKELGLK